MKHPYASSPWRVEVNNQVTKQMSRDPQLIERFCNALAKILSFPLGGMDTKPLQGQPGFFRCRVNGVLRLCYQVVENERLIYIHELGHRDDVY